MRLLGIDFGFKRIGIAVAEVEMEIVTARPSLTASGVLKRDAESIVSVGTREEVDGVVIGIPLEQGIEGKMAKICRRVAEEITALGLRVDCIDESMSSVQAERTLRDDGLKASERRKLKDGEAARLILERYMHEKKIS